MNEWIKTTRIIHDHTLPVSNNLRRGNGMDFCPVLLPERPTKAVGKKGRAEPSVDTGDLAAALSSLIYKLSDTRGKDNEC